MGRVLEFEWLVELGKQMQRTIKMVEVVDMVVLEVVVAVVGTDLANDGAIVAEGPLAKYWHLLDRLDLQGPIGT